MWFVILLWRLTFDDVSPQVEGHETDKRHLASVAWSETVSAATKSGAVEVCLSVSCHGLDVGRRRQLIAAYIYMHRLHIKRARAPAGQQEREEAEVEQRKTQAHQAPSADFPFCFSMRVWLVKKSAFLPSLVSHHHDNPHELFFVGFGISVYCNSTTTY